MRIKILLPKANYYVDWLTHLEKNVDTKSCKQQKRKNALKRSLNSLSQVITLRTLRVN